MTPEEIGLCGCWQAIAVRRERNLLNQDQEASSDEISYYVTSLTMEESTDQQLLEEIRAHWAAIENGVHYRRDVSFHEDQCRISRRGGAHIMASLRNLAIGLYEFDQARRKDRSMGCKSWCRRMTFSKAWALLRA